MNSRGGGYTNRIDAKADFRMWGGQKILTRRQQADLVGSRQGAVPDAPAGWPAPDMQSAWQAGASY